MSTGSPMNPSADVKDNDSVLTVQLLENELKSTSEKILLNPVDASKVSVLVVEAENVLLETSGDDTVPGHP